MTNELVSINVFDLPEAQFQKSLDLRDKNRKILLDWIRKSLIEDTDYGRIHVVKKSICNKGKTCKIDSHFSKPILFKPGSEKIAAKLGLTATFPNLPKYEEAAYSGFQIENIILRCELVANGVIVGYGAGGRVVSKEKGDLNKAIKMTLKSAQIDSTLRAAGLSEIFTQDMEDFDVEREGLDSDPDFRRDMEFKYGTKHKGKLICDVPSQYIAWCANNAKSELWKRMAKSELNARKSQEHDEKRALPAQMEVIEGLSKTLWGGEWPEKLEINVLEHFGASMADLTFIEARKVADTLHKAISLKGSMKVSSKGEKRDPGPSSAQTDPVEELIQTAMEQWAVKNRQNAIGMIQRLAKREGIVKPVKLLTNEEADHLMKLILAGQERPIL